MAETSGVFAGSPLDAAEDLARLFRQFAPSGVVTTGAGTDPPTDLGQQLEVTGNGTGLITIGTGYALVGGYWYRVAVPISRAVQANASTQARLDLVVVRADPATDQATTIIIPGSAGSGTAPAPTREGAGVWDVVLAVITVAGGSSVVMPGDVDTRVREFTSPSGAVPCLSSNRPPVPHRGMVALETDTGRVIVWSGSRWATVAETEYPTEWQPITLRSGYISPSHGRSPSWRWVRPGTVELRGTIARFHDSALPSGDYYARVPAAARPSGWVRDVCAAESRNSGGEYGAWARVEVASVNASNRLPGQIIAYHRHDPQWIALDGFIYDV